MFNVSYQFISAKFTKRMIRNLLVMISLINLLHDIMICMRQSLKLSIPNNCNKCSVCFIEYTPIGTASASGNIVALCVIPSHINKKVYTMGCMGCWNVGCTSTTLCFVNGSHGPSFITVNVTRNKQIFSEAHHIFCLQIVLKNIPTYWW